MFFLPSNCCVIIKACLISGKLSNRHFLNSRASNSPSAASLKDKPLDNTLGLASPTPRKGELKVG